MVPLHAVCATGLTDADDCQGLFMALWCLKEVMHCNPTDDPILLTQCDCDSHNISCVAQATRQTFSMHAMNRYYLCVPQV